MLEWNLVIKNRTAPLKFLAENTKYMCIRSAYGNGYFIHIQLSSLNRILFSCVFEALSSFCNNHLHHIQDPKDDRYVFPYFSTCLDSVHTAPSVLAL